MTDRDPASDPWAAYDELMRRCLELEEITERLAATSADWMAVEEWQTWKAGPENQSQPPPAAS